MNTTTTADQAYLAARDLLGPDRAGLWFRTGAEAAHGQAERLIAASEVLAFDAGMDARVDVRDTTQDLLDITELLVRRIDAAATIYANTDEVVAQYSAEFTEAIQRWRAAMSALLASMRQERA
jgi:hypothetical protein